MAAAVPYNMAAPTRPGLAGATCWRKWAWPRLSPLPAAAMAARRALRLAELQARALQPSPAPSLRIGQWRVTRGLAPSQSGPGPLRDLPDWSFAAPRPGPEPIAGRRPQRGAEPRGPAQPRPAPQGAPVRTSTDQ
ncbi:large ribosomal subunit protein mL52 isoform X2 [Anas platyrhynchos]|uniref:large ribosomal subunit protein mL52 isoform X2 n=1 Tax=Anas platyrhynchos TaxID=8839 RepID=UPI003AF2F5B7